MKFTSQELKKANKLIMSASEFLKSKIFPNLDKFNSLSLTTAELMNLLQEFALLKCADQREICAQEAELEGKDWAEVWIDKKSILNCPNPKM